MQGKYDWSLGGASACRWAQGYTLSPRLAPDYVESLPARRQRYGWRHIAADLCCQRLAQSTALQGKLGAELWLRAMTSNLVRSRVLPLPRLFSRQSIASDFWGLSDHALISATSLVTMIILARSLQPAEFGAFTLAYTVLLLANNFQTAFVTRPHNVLGSSFAGDDYVTFTSSLGTVQLVSAAALALLCVLAGVVLQLAGIAGSVLVLGLGGALFCWQVQEFLRRVLYSEGRIRDALINDVVSYGGQGLAIAALWRLGWLSGAVAMLVIAATSAAAVLVGLVQVRQSLTCRFNRGVLSQLWEFGKWLAAGEMGFWLSSTIYTYIAAALLGVAASGGLKAAQVILGPLNILLFYLDVVLPIKFAKTLSAGEDVRLSSSIRTTYITTLPLVAGYSLVAALFASFLLRFAYGADYKQYATVVVIVAATSLLSYLGRVLTAALQAFRMTKAVFHSHFIGAVLSVSVGWILVERFGVEGAALGIGLSSLVRYALLLRALRGARASVTASLAPM